MYIYLVLFGQFWAKKGKKNQFGIFRIINLRRNRNFLEGVGFIYFPWPIKNRELTMVASVCTTYWWWIWASLSCSCKSVSTNTKSISIPWKCLEIQPQLTYVRRYFLDCEGTCSWKRLSSAGKKQAQYALHQWYLQF